MIGPLTDRFTLAFEEGFRVIPWVNPRGALGPLEKIEITFVYSDGSIHSLSSKTIHSNDKLQPPPEDGKIPVVYKWIEMEDVDMESGAFVMFLFVFVTSIYMLVDMCGLCGTDEQSAGLSGSGRDRSGRDYNYSASTGLPKDE